MIDGRLDQTPMAVIVGGWEGGLRLLGLQVREVIFLSNGSPLLTRQETHCSIFVFRSLSIVVALGR